MTQKSAKVLKNVVFNSMMGDLAQKDSSFFDGE